MWKCTRCGREFSQANQDHSCGEPSETVDLYIASQPENIRRILNSVRETLRAALPHAQERISWRMPTFWDKRNIIHFAAFRQHVGLYPGPEAIVHFADRLTEYKTSKGAIRFPYDKPLPVGLISEIAKWCRQTGNRL